jgi:hypothetical protein
MTEIRTPDQRLRVFVSSTMKELASARAAARTAIERLRLIPVLFELGARPHPPRELYLAYLRQSDVFIGIYGQQYGWIAPDQKISGLEDEYLNAGGKPKLVYVQPRLVTLVGPGGIGKTRLALEVGAALTSAFDDVVMVALDEVSSADLVVSSIAASLGVPEAPGRSLLDLVVNYLQTRRMLLIVDNFEHLMVAAGVLGQLVTHADRVVLLVTSRERLRLSGERVVEVVGARKSVAYAACEYSPMRPPRRSRRTTHARR